MGAATQELASYLIVDKFHGGSQSAQIETTPEGLATEIKATQLFLDLGLGVGVGVLAGGIKSVGKDTAENIWSSTKTLSSIDNAKAHWDKHGNEFPEYNSFSQYMNGALDFVKNPPENILIKNRQNGDILLYDQKNNIFAVKSHDGSPKTMFKPIDGMEYWEK